MKNDTVMIVDDALFMRSMLRRALEGARDLDVIEAASGAEAVEKYREGRPGLVLMDISMPGMNGIEALKEIRGIDEDACVVMCSAIGQENMIAEAVAAGAVSFIVKPFKPDQILKAVEMAFPHRRSGGAS